MPKVEFEAGGVAREGYLALPESGRGPGILLLHAWWGLTPFFREACDRLARDGFAVFAPDLHHGKTATTIDEAETLMSEQDFPAVEATAKASVGFLRSHPAIDREALGAVGFSMGGSLLMHLLSLDPGAFAAATLFYDAYAVDLQGGNTRFQGHYGELDEWTPLSEARKLQAHLEAAGYTLELHTYPNHHWFFESNRPEFDPASAALAYERTVAFLRKHL